MEKMSEQIHYEGGQENIVKVFSEIKRFAIEGKQSGKSPTLLVLGGAQRGAYSGGGVIALEKEGLRNGFDTVIGISTGAPVVSYFITGQSVVGTTIYYDDNTKGKFIKPRELRVDITWLCDTFRGKYNDKGLDVQKLKESETEVIYAATRESDGECVFLKAKEMEDPIEGIRASAAIPFLYRDDVVIDGTRYLDGDLSGTLPIKKIISEVNPTSLLIFANRPAKQNGGMMYKLIKRYAEDEFDKKYLESLRNQDQEFMQELDLLKKSGIPYTIIWTDNLVGSLEVNSTKLENAAKRYEEYVRDLIRGVK